MNTSASTGRPPAPVHLILGEEELLAERARDSIIAAVRASLVDGADLPITTLRTGEVEVPAMIELLSPSLFAEERVIVFTKAHEAGKEPTEILLDAAKNPAPGIYMIIMHTGGGRQKAVVPKLKKLSQVHEVPKMSPRDRPSWVAAEFRSHGVNVTPDVVNALLEGVGSDLRELASAVSQLVADTNGNVTAEVVRGYYVGVAEVSGFDIADLACTGQLSKALASTRRALQLGVSPVALAAALSMNVSAIARLYSTRGSVNTNQLAGVVGMPPWKVDKTLKMARRWTGDAVTEAVIVMAELDAATKGQGNDPDYAIERAVRKIAQLAG